MKKVSDASLGSGSTAFPSSGASKDRQPLQVNSGRGHGSSGAALLPLGKRRSVPSKWEDAEKWICSPVSLDGFAAKGAAVEPPPFAAYRRRPKSKSGPLGPHCEPSLPSPLMVHDLDDGRAKTYTANSPTLSEINVEDGGLLDVGRYPRVDGFFGWETRANFHHNRARPGESASVPGWSELLAEAASSSLNSSQEEKNHIMQDGARNLSNVERRDMGTQMSPQGSTCSSPDANFQASSHPPQSLTFGELHKHLSKLEVRDVQVDHQVTTKRWSKRHFPRGSDRSSPRAKQHKQKALEPWEVAATGEHMSKLETEESRILAWENFQKAKAEAAIKELEMKLEKKRSSSMDKILSKLSSAQKKAEEMRKSLAGCEGRQAADVTSRKPKLLQRTNRLSFLNGCFYGQALP